MNLFNVIAEQPGDKYLTATSCLDERLEAYYSYKYQREREQLMARCDRLYNDHLLSPDF
jgi:hypothetical protein